MRIAGIVVAVFVLLVYLALMRIDPLFGLMHPRGGIFILGLSLLIANAAIHAAAQPHRSLELRFQLAAAGWIWLLVQAGCIVWLYLRAPIG